MNKYWIFFLRKPEKDDLVIGLLSFSVILLTQCINTHFVFVGWAEAWSSIKDGIIQDLLGGLLITILYNTYKCIRILSKDKKFKRQLKRSIDKVIVATESEDKNNKLDRNKNMFYLTEIINNQINVNRFMPDFLTIDELYDCNTILSITEAPIAAWLDPTYIYFLMCQVVKNVTKNVPPKNVHTCRAVKKDILSRENLSFYFQESYNILKRFKEMNVKAEDKLDILNKAIAGNDIRLYFMDYEDIENNKGLIECFVAANELAGIHLFIIDRKIIKDYFEDDYNWMCKIIGVGKDAYSEKKLDFALRFYEDKQPWYASRTLTGEFHDIQIESSKGPVMFKMLSFLNKLSENLLNDKKVLFYPNEQGRFNTSYVKENGDTIFREMIFNEEKTQIAIKN